MRSGLVSRAHPGVAALTAKGARVAGGPVSRRGRAAAVHSGASRRTAHVRAERIQLLLTTDLLSEGLNLQEASVVVHLDYPWNPARLDQRVGRVRRIGSRHESVTVYALAPPAPVERILQLESRLAAKLRVANRTIGVAGRHPSGVDRVPLCGNMVSPTRRRAETPPGDLAERRARSRRTMLSPIVAAVRSDIDGFLALVSGESTPMLVPDLADDLSTAPDRLLAAARASDCLDVAPDLATRAAALDCDSRPGSHTGARRRASTSAPRLSSRTRRLALNRVAHALSRAPRHRRTLLAPLAAAARAAATAPLAEGAERVLDTLVAADLPDEAWLRSVAAFGELNARPASTFDAAVKVAAIILLQTGRPEEVYAWLGSRSLVPGNSGYAVETLRPGTATRDQTHDHRPAFMQYTTLGTTGLTVSRICLGCMSYGNPKWRTVGARRSGGAAVFSRRDRERDQLLRHRRHVLARHERGSDRPRAALDGQPRRDRARDEGVLADERRAEHARPVAQACRAGVRGEPSPAGRRDDRSVSDPPLRRIDADRRDARGASTPRPAGESAVPRRELRVRVAAHARAQHLGAKRVGALRLDADRNTTCSTARKSERCYRSAARWDSA